MKPLSIEKSIIIQHNIQTEDIGNEFHSLNAQKK